MSCRPLITLILVLCLLANAFLLEFQRLNHVCYRVAKTTKTFALNIQDTRDSPDIITMKVDVDVTNLETMTRQHRSNQSYLLIRLNTRCRQTLNINKDLTRREEIILNSRIFVFNQLNSFSEHLLTISAIKSSPIELPDLNGHMSLYVQIQNSSGEIIPEGNIKDSLKALALFRRNEPQNRLSVMMNRFRKIIVEYKSKDSQSGNKYIVSIRFELFLNAGTESESANPSISEKLDGYTLPKKSQKFAKNFSIIVPISKQPMRLWIFVNNVDSLKEELATYMIEGLQQRWISDSSDFQILNFEIEEFNPNEYYVGRESAILLLPSAIDRKSCELHGQTGFILQIIYLGRPIDKLAFCHLYVDESKSISIITRLGENNREKCLRNAK
ncbi:hypothetical protein RF11_00975 [Thelohanellus kitauei]|uniref:Uncharacterized protein n=1 Tax=Thelohanellus kitauei TaxID=669202 RepID=A0A0C2MJ05_THEKT|nr:hypothetical protein RF11_00975 [Thelohanellus kitauei]